MIPQRFIQSYKCECFQPHNYCNCPYKAIAAKIHMENVQDVAETLVEVMEICHISLRKARLSAKVVTKYFLHFEELLQRIDAIPKKRLLRENLLHDLQGKCDMQPMEVQMSYSIVKRAFRAFYHGSGEGGVPNPWLHSQLKHTAECMWAHAATRTAQVFTAYEGMFMVTQKNVVAKIRGLYKRLYDRICERSLPNENQECTCTTCPKRLAREGLRAAKVTTGMHKVSDPYEEMYQKIVKEIRMKQENETNNEEAKDLLNVSRKPCTCPALKPSDSDLTYDQLAKSCNTGYSQGPFDCRWFDVKLEEYESDDLNELEISLPQEFSCFPCSSGKSEELSICESVCECEACSCQTEECDYGEGNAESLYLDEEVLFGDNALDESDT
uniref:Uncharacterized protein n=1 Tax=Stomoxys calcitrans TaxID=35570 RepID=A0A1I8NVP9_STOCA